MSTFCTSCGAELRPDSKYCVSCGSVAPASRGHDAEGTQATANTAGPTGPTGPSDPYTDHTVLSARRTSHPTDHRKASVGRQPAVWIAAGSVALVVLVIVVMLAMRGKGETAAPLVPAPPAPATTVTATVPAVPTPTVTVTAAPAPAAAPVNTSCTAQPNTQLRYANVGGWQVCTTGTWGDGLARNAADRVTGTGEYTNVPDKVGDLFNFSCFWVTTDTLKCTGGNVKNNSPSGIESSLILTRA